MPYLFGNNFSRFYLCLKLKRFPFRHNEIQDYGKLTIVPLLRPHMSKALTPQEIHNLAMNHVGKDLEARGFEFIAINSKLKRHPQFVCIDKNKQYYFVVVRAVILPENPNNYDVVWMETFKKHAYEKDAKVLYAGVGLGNPNGEDLPIYLNEEYLIEYNGIQVIEMNLN